MNTAIQEVEAILKDGIDQLGATSCTFYVRDPLWTNEFRLVCMPGVEIPEPMHGFVFPAQSWNRVLEGPAFRIYPDAENEPELLDELPHPLKRIKGVSKKRIYHEFVRREGVKSSARILYPRARPRKATLWINFNKKRSASYLKKKEPQMRLLMKTVAPYIHKIREELKEDATKVLRRLTQITEPASRLVEVGSPRKGEVDLHEYFESICKAVLEAFGISEKDGFASIHVFRPGTHLLEVCSSCGITEKEKPALAFQPGEGVTSWVAHRQKAVLIQDVHDKRCRFRSIFQPSKNGTVTELAVPMVVRDKVVGVLNVESRRKNTFNPLDVRFMWYAANQAATATRLYRQRVLTTGIERLFEVYSDAVSGKGEMGSHLDKLARVFGEWMYAEKCEIWLYDPKDDEFANCGSSYPEFDCTKKPRKNGWSRHIMDNECSVWIDNVRDLGRFDAYRRDEEEGKWEKLKTGKRPHRVNRRVKELNVHCELGIPIRARGDCIGVSWLKYADMLEERFTGEGLTQALGLSAHVGMVMDVLRRYQESVKGERERVRRDIERFKDALFPPEPRKLPGLRYAVRSEAAEDPIGGDFYAVVQPDDDDETVGFLLGDVTGHGIPAALRMLPIFSTFWAAYGDSRSTTYVLEQMNRVTHQLGLDFCSALYFIIEQTPSGPPNLGSMKLRLRASAAGEIRIVIKGPGGLNIKVFPETKDSTTISYPLGTSSKILVGGDSCELNYGDIIVGFTDGITEAKRPGRSGKHFEIDGVVHVLTRKTCPKDPQGIVDAIFEAAKKHTRGKLKDDATVMVVKLERPDN